MVCYSRVRIEFATLSGFEVITTCSPHNFDLVKSYGAVHVYDHNSSSTIREIQSVTGGKLGYAVDCISTPRPQTSARPSSVLVESIRVLAWRAHLARISPPYQTLGWSFLGEPWDLGGQRQPASQEDFEHSMAFAELNERLLMEGKIRPHPVEVRDGGLAVVPEGMTDLKAKNISGRKLVVGVD